MSTKTQTTFNFNTRNLASFTDSIGLTNRLLSWLGSFTDSIGLTNINRITKSNSDINNTTLLLEDLMYGLVNANKTTLNGYSKLDNEDSTDLVSDDIETSELAKKKLSKSDDKTKNLELLKLAWTLIPSKTFFIIAILVFEIVSSLGTIGLLLENKLIVIVAPIIMCIISLLNEISRIDIMYKIKCSWLKTTLNYFNDLSWVKRNEQEDMTDFHKMIGSSSNTLFSLISWGIPTIVTGIRSLVMVIYILIIKGYWKIIIVTTIIYYVYFAYVMKSLQEKIALVRSKMKDMEKIIVSKRKWLLQLFKNKKRNPSDIIKIDVEFDSLEKEFIQGWQVITNGMSLVSSLISFIALFGISDWNNLLLVKIIFDELRYTIETFSHFSNNFTSRAKDFDKFLTWYEETGGRDKKIEYFPIPPNGIEYESIHINIDDKFLLDSTKICIEPNDIIILRGPTGVGKTQLINSLQGLIPGANLTSNISSNIQNIQQIQIYNPRSFQPSWEYLDQNMRETIPSNGLTLREMLGNEPNTELILDLIKVVRLDDKIPSKSDIDVKMKGFSGGQRMKLSLIFTLLEVINKVKSSKTNIEQGLSILVLDEPEQGLDPYSRLDVISSILEFCKLGIKKYIKINLSVLIIYHGDNTDIIKMNKLVNKFWLLKKHQGKTIVEEITEIKEFCKSLLELKRQELENLYAELNV
jgi:ABC-type multidrug transport system ATPase subunit